jgi:hypothetical protein
MDASKAKKVINKLYISLLVAFIGIACLFFGLFIVVGLHDELVAKSDFECVDRLAKNSSLAGTTITVPPERMNIRGEILDGNATAVEQLGQLEKCNVRFIEWEKAYNTTRAWTDGKRDTSYFSRASIFLAYFAIFLSAAVLVVLGRKWIGWLAS